MISESQLPSLAAQCRDASLRSRALITEARNRSDALQQLIATTKLRVRDSKALLERATAASGLPYHIFAEAQYIAVEQDANQDGAARTFPAISDLIERVERATARDEGLAVQLIEDILLALQNRTNPSLLTGILLEGIAQTVLELLPEDERRNAAIALCGLLWDRVSQGLAEQD